jgi:hypothetical protein
MASNFFLRKAEALLKRSFDLIILIFWTQMLHCFKKKLGEKGKQGLNYICIREGRLSAFYTHITHCKFLLKILFYYSNNMRCVWAIASGLQAMVRSLSNEDVK